MLPYRFTTVLIIATVRPFQGVAIFDTQIFEIIMTVITIYNNELAIAAKVYS